MSVAEPLIQASLIGEALDHGPVAVFVFDEDMHYVAVNAYACELLGYSRTELMRVGVHQVARTADYRDRGTFRHKDGHSVEMRYSVRETTVAGMTFYVGVGWALS